MRRLEREFGAEVALLVDGVTKLGQLSYSADKVEAAGRKSPQDVSCHGKGYPRYSDQACRPASQYAYPAVYETGEAAGKSKRDHGYLCTDRACALVFPRSR